MRMGTIATIGYVETTAGWLLAQLRLTHLLME